MEKNITPDSVISALMNHTKSADSDFPVHVFPAKMQRIILELNTTCAFPIDYTISYACCHVCGNRQYPSCQDQTQLAEYFRGNSLSVLAY